MSKENTNFNRNLKTILGGLAVSCLMSHQLRADDANDWRLRSQRYSTGAVKYVAKNVGCLDVTLNVTCQRSPKDARQKAWAVLAEISQIVKTETPEVTKASPDVAFDDKSEARYTVTSQDNEPLKNKITDACEKFFDVEPSANLNQKVFSTAITIRFQVTDKVAAISKVRQRINAYREDLKTDSPAVLLTVGQEQYSVDPAAIEQDNKELGETSRLAKQQSRLTIDEKVFGGFSEKYITAVEDNPAPAFQYIRPTLDDASGKSVLEANYNFRVEYLPKNDVTNLPSKYSARGQLTKTVTGKTIVPTDYYKTDINITTTCHETADDAKAALVTYFNKILEKANAIAGENPLDYKNHVSLGTAANPTIDRDVYKEWTFNKAQNDRDTRVVVSYLSLCDGKTYPSQNPPDRYKLSQNFSLTATNYKALIELQELAAQINEDSSAAGARAVVVNVAKLQPTLDAGNQQTALEVTAYQNALEKLLSPNGELANALLDEIGASEAYYEFLSYEPTASAYEDRPQVAAMAAPGGARSARQLKPNNDLNLVDKNIPLQRVAVFKEYTLQFRPKKDLVKTLTELRKAAATKTIKAPN